MTRRRLLRPYGAVCAAMCVVTVGTASCATVERSSPALVDLVEAERAFARTNMNAGQRVAWLEWFAVEGVMFRSGAVNAQAFMRGNPAPPPAPPGAFDWRPIYGDVSEAGDLGYNTGPVKVTSLGRSDRFFFSVWRRGADGRWKVVVDLGGPVDLSGHDPFDDPFTPARTAVAQSATARSGPALAELDGAPDIAALWDPHIRGLRTNVPPLVGRQAFVQYYARVRGVITHHPVDAGIARSDDLAYTYGRYTIAAPTDETGDYARAWRRDARGVWRIVYDVARPDVGPATGLSDQ